jgi:hypothetical protein
VGWILKVGESDKCMEGWSLIDNGFLVHIGRGVWVLMNDTWWIYT